VRKSVTFLTEPNISSATGTLLFAALGFNFLISCKLTNLKAERHGLCGILANAVIDAYSGTVTKSVFRDAHPHIDSNSSMMAWPKRHGNYSQEGRLV